MARWTKRRETELVSGDYDVQCDGCLEHGQDVARLEEGDTQLCARCVGALFNEFFKDEVFRL